MEMDWGVFQALEDTGLGWGILCEVSVTIRVPTGPTKWGLVLERLIVLGWTFSDMLTRGQVFVGRLLELHVLKLVALYTIWVAVQEVPALHSWGGRAQPDTQGC